MPGRFADLGTRVASGVVLGAGAVSLLALGGPWSALMIAGLAAAMGWEWRSITWHGGAAPGPDGALLAGGLAAAVLAGHWAGEGAAFAVVLITAGASLWCDARQLWSEPGHGHDPAPLPLVGVRSDQRAPAARREGRWGWGSAGALYLGTACVAFGWLRDHDPFGFWAAVWVILVVAAADIGGYFAGRLIGGPRLWPSVSPKKTWAGLGGGVALAFVAGGVFSWATVGTYYQQVCAVSAVAALLSQAGDLGESALKRRFGVKDSGRLIPGHGGALDRLDGLLAASLVAAGVTWARGQTVFIW